MVKSKSAYEVPSEVMAEYSISKDILKEGLSRRQLKNAIRAIYLAQRMLIESSSSGEFNLRAFIEHITIASEILKRVADELKNVNKTFSGQFALLSEKLREIYNPTDKRLKISPKSQLKIWFKRLKIYADEIISLSKELKNLETKELIRKSGVKP